MNLLSKAVFPLISFVATLVLTLVASYVVHLDDKASYVIFATGTSISLALTLIEQRAGPAAADFPPPEKAEAQDAELGRSARFSTWSAARDFAVAEATVANRWRASTAKRRN